MTTVPNGLIGGLVAAVVAATVTRAAADSSATSEALAAVLGGDVATSRWWGFPSQLGYGTVAGGVLVALELSVLGALAVPPATGEALAVAVGWSAVLFFAAVAVRRFGLSLPLDRSALLELSGFHLVYGLGLGVWIRLTWIT